MAGNPACMSDDGNLAVFIGTNLDTGDTVTLCPPCLIQFCATIVESSTGVPVTQLIAIDAELGVEPEDEIDEPEIPTASPTAPSGHSEPLESPAHDDTAATVTQ